MSRPGPAEPAGGGLGSTRGRPAAGIVRREVRREGKARPVIEWGEGRLAHADAGAGPDAGQRVGAGEPDHRQGRAAARRSTALRISAATTIDRATAVQISHCGTSRVVVRITVWKMPRTVDRSSRSKDSPVVRTNVLSEKALGGERRLDREEQEGQRDHAHGPGLGGSAGLSAQLIMLMAECDDRDRAVAFPGRQRPVLPIPGSSGWGRRNFGVAQVCP